MKTDTLIVSTTSKTAGFCALIGGRNSGRDSVVTGDQREVQCQKTGDAPGQIARPLALTDNIADTRQYDESNDED